MVIVPGATYRVVLERTGRASLTSRDEFAKIVSSVGRVDPLEFSRLCQLMDRLGFSKMAPTYSSQASDTSVTVVTRVIRGQETSVFNDSDLGPIELWAIEQAIDNVRRGIRWKKMSTVKTH